MLKRLERLSKAADDNRPVSDLVRDAIRDYIRREEGRCEKCGQEKPATEQEAGARDRRDLEVKQPETKNLKKGGNQ